jgi:ATP-dependent Lon protease
MTGEITLRGKVLPIGGLKEKMLAAIRAGITTIIIPEQNRKDLEEIPKHILKKVRIVSARVIDDVLKVALEKYPPAGAAKNLTPKGKATSGRVIVTPRKGIVA